jgi:hypothetical protein
MTGTKVIEMVSYVEDIYTRATEALTVGIMYSVYSRSPHYDNINRYANDGNKRQKIKDAAPTNEQFRVMVESIPALLAKIRELEAELERGKYDDVPAH